MKKVISHIVAPLGIAVTTAFLTLVRPVSVSALNIYDGVEAARGESVPSDLFGASGIFTTVVNVLLFVIGAVAVVMLIVGGLRYAISGGNSTAVSAAKNTILYAIVGLIIAFLSYAIINFVMNAITGGTSGYTDV